VEHLVSLKTNSAIPSANDLVDKASKSYNSRCQQVLLVVDNWI